jgi:DNA polymerase I
MRVSTFMGRSHATIPGRVSVDVYSLVKEAANKFGLFKGLKRYGLGDVSENVLGETKVDVAHSEINGHWNDSDDKLGKLLNYSRKDAELPIKILFKKNMLDKFIEICKVSGINLQDCLDRGETERIDSILLREFNKKNFVIPCKPDNKEVSRRNAERRNSGLKGAFVLEPVVGFHQNCVAYLDFKSMYPSIVISYNICPTTLLQKKAENIKYMQTPFGSKFVDKDIKKGILPDILDYLLETRSKIKKQMKASKKESRKNYLYSKQYAFKTVANAFYGYSGYIRARFYVLDIASGITSTGRHLIKKTKEIVHSKTPYTVIYGDTDSVMVELKTKDLKEAFKIGDEVSDIINEGINHILHIKIESIFKTVILLAKKRYAAWNFEPMKEGWDETVLTKGIETVRRDWCDLVSETLKNVLDTILKEQDVDQAVKIVKETVNNIKMGNIPVDKLVITKSISRSPKNYKGVQPHVELLKKMRKRDPTSAPGVGDRVGYVIVKGTQMISKRAEDPEYVKDNKIPIDSKYYIESQLLPPLERVFEVLKVSKTDLTGIGRQIGLFEAMKNGGFKQESEYEDSFSKIEGFICDKCNNIYKRPPLTGKCNSCGGEILFKNGEKKSKVFIPG